MFGNQQGDAALTHNEHVAFASAAVAAVHEAHENIVFGEVPHDVLAIHSAAAAQQHHAHLLVRPVRSPMVERWLACRYDRSPCGSRGARFSRFDSVVSL